MNKNPQKNSEISAMIEPWREAFVAAVQCGYEDMLAAVPIVGIPRVSERGGLIHCTLRGALRHLCDVSEPFLTLIEEPEGRGGMDYILLDYGGRRLVLRWTKISGNRISRNRTARQTAILEQGCFSFHEEHDNENVPSVTMTIMVEDDYIEANALCGWIGRIAVIRERSGQRELVNELAVFQKPERMENYHRIDIPRLRTQKKDFRRIETLAEVARRQVG